MKNILVVIVFLLSALLSFAQPKANLKVGILSDVHITDEKSKETFIKALEYFKDADVDAIMIAGDMIECGMAEELENFSKLWYSVFPKDKGLKGHAVEKLFVYGNHEINGHTFNNAKKKYSQEQIKEGNISISREQLWKKCFKEDFQPIYMKTIKGYCFIGAHFENTKNVPGLEDFFASVDAQLPKDKPFFYFQHIHPKGTCSGDSVWGQDDGSSTEILRRYPNVISFSGHSHTTITDERTIWQGEFTSVGTGSLKYVSMLGKDHENGKLQKDYVSQMYRLNGRNGHQGMLMSVFEDRVELLRHEFEFDEDLGVWTIPTDISNRPYSFETRANTVPSPEFEANAKVRISQKEEGKDSKKNIVAQEWIWFPSIARNENRPRAYDFQVDVELMDGDVPEVIASKKVFAYGVYLGEQKDVEHKSLCVFAKSELPEGKPYRYAIYPMNCFGKKGSPLYSSILNK